MRVLVFCVWDMLFLPRGKKLTETFSLTVLVWFYICIFKSVFRRKLSFQMQQKLHHLKEGNTPCEGVTNERRSASLIAAASALQWVSCMKWCTAGAWVLLSFPAFHLGPDYIYHTLCCSRFSWAESCRELNSRFLKQGKKALCLKLVLSGNLAVVEGCEKRVHDSLLLRAEG